MNALLIDACQVRITSFHETTERDSGYTVGEFTCAPRKYMIKCIEDGEYHDVLFYTNPVEGFHELTHYYGVKLEVIDVETRKDSLQDIPQLTVRFKTTERVKESLDKKPVVCLNYIDEMPLIYRDCYEFINKYKKN